MTRWSIYLFCWLFLVYGVLGVVIETAYCLVRERVLESRLGLLYLPLRPMYGIGGVACTVLLSTFQQHPVMVLVGGALICSVVEYAAGSICEKAFGTVSWDYRGKLLHLHGKICLQYSCYWGVLAGLAVYVVSPLITTSVSRLDRSFGETFVLVLMTLTASSLLLTTAAWGRARRRLGDHRPGAEATVPARSVAIGDLLLDRLAPDRVLISTFPRTRLARELTALTGRQQPLIARTSRPVSEPVG